MPEFQKKHGPLSEEQIVEAEAKLGIQLPESYRAFLCATDGGALAEAYVVPESGGAGLITQFWDVNSLVEMQHGGFGEVIPYDYVSVAVGGGGSACVKVTGDEIGSVWWADYDEADRIGAEDPTQEVMTKMTDDFDSFLALVDQAQQSREE